MTDNKNAPEKGKTHKEKEEDLDEELKETFPASDTPASIQPGRAKPSWQK